MDQKTNIPELLLRPAFSVEDGRITRINREAEKYFLEEGMPIEQLIATGQEEYESFREGILSLTLCIQGQNMTASVQHTDQGRLFILEQEQQDAYLQSLSLAAQELRGPLAGMMATMDRLEMPDSQLNRRMYQMLRIIGNMSDAVRFASYDAPQEYVDAVALMRDIFDRTAAYAEVAGFTLHFSAPTGPIYTLANRELLERAVYNLLSNAMKFSQNSAAIRIGLTQRGNRLCLTFEDSGRGIAQHVQSSLFQRYQRQPGIEDPCLGLGLGMVLVRQAAAVHGGTVLIDHPKGISTRVTLTLSIRHSKASTTRSPVLHIDYTGERDHALVELSDVLPAELYASDNLR